MEARNPLTNKLQLPLYKKLQYLILRSMVLPSRVFIIDDNHDGLMAQKLGIGLLVEDESS